MFNFKLKQDLYVCRSDNMEFEESEESVWSLSLSFTGKSELAVKRKNKARVIWSLILKASVSSWTKCYVRVSNNFIVTEWPIALLRNDEKDNCALDAWLPPTLLSRTLKQPIHATRKDTVIQCTHKLRDYNRQSEIF